MAVFAQLARDSTRQPDVTVQHALAYTVHELFVAVRDDRFTQFGRGYLEHVQGVVVRPHSLHPPLRARR